MTNTLKTIKFRFIHSQLVGNRYSFTKYSLIHWCVGPWSDLDDFAGVDPRNSLIVTEACFRHTGIFSWLWDLQWVQFDGGRQQNHIPLYPDVKLQSKWALYHLRFCTSIVQIILWCKRYISKNISLFILLLGKLYCIHKQ